MSGFKIDEFAGEAPRIRPRKLPPGFAQTAQNCNLQRGNLGPLKSGLFVWTPTKVGTIQSIYKFGGSFWFHWTTDVDVVQGPIANDTQERTYFTGDGVPKVTDASIATSGGGTDYPTVSYNLGLPSPAAAPGTSLGAGGGCADKDQESVTFVYTYVTAWGEEGPPSSPSAVVDVCAGQTVTVTGMSTGPAGAYNVTTKRIYAATLGTGYQYVGELPVATTSFEITSFDVSAFAEELPSTTWYAPPTDMHSITMLPNGIAAGLSGKTVCFCEPYLLHAWPTEYQLLLDDDGISTAAVGQSVVVTTEKSTYLISGVDPAGMSMVKLEANQACVSKRSMVDMGVFALYASPDGLVAASPSGEIKLITKELLTRDQWQAYKPDSIHAYVWEGQYVAFYDTGTVQSGFIFDPSSGSFTHLDYYATAGFNDPKADALYLVVNGNIVQFNAGAAQTYTWKSKLFITPKPVNFGACQVIATSYPVTMKLYADGVLKATKSVVSNRGVRLPAGFLATDWEVELSGTGEVEEVIVVETMRELAQA